MKSIYHMLAIGAIAVILTGCETVKSTLSGPFIGLEKDINNFQAAAHQTTSQTAAVTPAPVANATPAPQATQVAPVVAEEAPQKSVKKSIDDLDAWMQKNWW